MLRPWGRNETKRTRRKIIGFGGKSNYIRGLPPKNIGEETGSDEEGKATLRVKKVLFKDLDYRNEAMIEIVKLRREIDEKKDSLEQRRL